MTTYHPSRSLRASLCLPVRFSLQVIDHWKYRALCATPEMWHLKQHTCSAWSDVKEAAIKAGPTPPITVKGVFLKSRAHFSIVPALLSNYHRST